jgi:PIN domain nuclease of toxin-antitoxin system
VGDPLIYLDTHTLVWLYKGEPDKLGPGARKAIDQGDLVAPAAAVLELELLHEIRRLKVPASTLIAGLAADIDLRVCELTFRMVAEFALKERWTRDPFDRLIVANAKAADAGLVTKDSRMHKHYPRAIW